MPLDSLLIAVSALLFMILAVLDRRSALVMFCALLPTYLMRTAIPLPIGALVSLPTTLLELFFWILFVMWLAFWRRRDGTVTSRLWTPGMTLLLVGASLGTLVASDIMPALGVWRAYFIEPMLFFFMFTDMVRDASTRKKTVGALVATLAAIGLLAIYQKITGWGIPNPVWQAEATRRVTAFYGFPNGIGLFAAPVTVLAVAWTYDTARRVTKLRDALLPTLTGASAALGLLAVVFAVSEGAMLGMACGLLALGLLVRALRPYTLGAIIVICALTMLYAPLRNYASVMLSMNDDSWGVRKIVWQESLDMLRDRPVFGAGLSGYQTALKPYHLATHIEIFMYPHNLFLNFWSETGIIGLAGFLLLLWTFFRSTARLFLARTDGWLPVALFCAMLAITVHGMVDVPYMKNDLAFLFFILLGLTESLNREFPPQTN